MHHGARGGAEQRGGRASGQERAGNQRQRIANHGRSHRFSGVPPLTPLSKLPGISAFVANAGLSAVQLLSTRAAHRASGNFFRHPREALSSK
ncbi:hypothetical protein BDI4_60124 [Burkholderia diffusa]|nr:hypothetical protein BDI4_60124 [Burkholderia diffusa]